MALRKHSICVGAQLAELLDGLPNSDTMSGRINRTVERYLAILSDCPSPLSVDEYRLLRETLDGHRLPAAQIRNLPAIVADSPIGRTQRGLCMIETLKGCTYAELVAILELIGL